MKQSQLLLEFLYRALAAKYGIVVRVDSSNTATTVQALYKARQESGDPALKRLQIRRSPVSPNSELWIAKNAEEEGSPTQEASRLFVRG
jgi:hypothetical protein